jgi:prephenate dehydratase
MDEIGLNSVKTGFFRVTSRIIDKYTLPMFAGAKNAVVSIQGQPGSFHHIAGRKLFGDVEYLYRDSFREVFEDYRTNRANFILIAIENSIAGSIIYNYDLISKYRIPIIAEVYEHIAQHLIAFPGVELDSIQEVWSHPMAIEQCREFLNDLPVKIVEKADTAGSVREIKELGRKDVAVISSGYSAELYGMNILRPGIQTDPNNYTRFLLMSEVELQHVSTDEVKTSLWFGVPNSAGSLLRILEVLDKYNINMTKLESRPRPGTVWAYDFFADVSMDGKSESGGNIISELRNRTEFLEVLGIYSERRAGSSI